MDDVAVVGTVKTTVQSVYRSAGVSQQQFAVLEERVADVEVLIKVFEATFEYSEDNVTAVSIPAFKTELTNQ